MRKSNKKKIQKPPFRHVELDKACFRIELLVAKLVGLLDITLGEDAASYCIKEIQESIGVIKDIADQQDDYEDEIIRLEAEVTEKNSVIDILTNEIELRSPVILPAFSQIEYVADNIQDAWIMEALTKLLEPGRPSEVLELLENLTDPDKLKAAKLAILQYDILR